MQAANKELSSKHWEVLRDCGQGLLSYKHSSTGHRVVVKVINWPQPDGKERKGIILCASDHKGYDRFLKKLSSRSKKAKKAKTMVP